MSVPKRPVRAPDAPDAIGVPMASPARRISFTRSGSPFGSVSAAPGTATTLPPPVVCTPLMTLPLALAWPCSISFASLPASGESLVPAMAIVSVVVVLPPWPSLVV